MKRYEVEADSLEEAVVKSLKQFLSEPNDSYLCDSFEIDGIIEDEYPDIINANCMGYILNLIVRESDPKGVNSINSVWDLLRWQVGKEINYIESLRDSKFNIYSYDLMDLPSADAISNAINKLYILGAITSNCSATPLGFIMSRFGLLIPEAAKLIMSGYAWGAPICDLITIGCLMSFIKSSSLYSKRGEPYNKKMTQGSFNLFGGKENYLKTQLILCCDMLMFIVVWNEFQKCVSQYLNDDGIHVMEWCRNNGLDYSVMTEIIEYRDDTIDMLSKIGFDPYANFSSSVLLKNALVLILMILYYSN
jgi:hypothetical protein